MNNEPYCPSCLQSSVPPMKGEIFGSRMCPVCFIEFDILGDGVGEAAGLRTGDAASDAARGAAGATTCSKAHRSTVGHCVYCERDAALRERDEALAKLSHEIELSNTGLDELVSSQEREKRLRDALESIRDGNYAPWLGCAATARAALSETQPTSTSSVPLTKEEAEERKLDKLP